VQLTSRRQWLSQAGLTALGLTIRDRASLDRGMFVNMPFSNDVSEVPVSHHEFARKIDQLPRPLHFRNPNSPVVHNLTLPLKQHSSGDAHLQPESNTLTHLLGPLLGEACYGYRLVSSEESHPFARILAYQRPTKCEYRIFSADSSTRLSVVLPDSLAINYLTLEGSLVADLNPSLVVISDGSLTVPRNQRLVSVTRGMSDATYRLRCASFAGWETIVSVAV
jgi:hypothetical protein